MKHILHLVQQLATLRALTLQQPYASLSVDGHKHHETRSWSVSYRGWLLIHAGKEEFKGWRENQDLVDYMRMSYRGKLRGHARSGLVGAVFLSDVRPAEQVKADRLTMPQELAFGNFDDGRFGWKMEAPLAFPEPIDCGGHQGLWIPPAALLTQLPYAVLVHLATNLTEPKPWAPALVDFYRSHL